MNVLLLKKIHILLFPKWLRIALGKLRIKDCLMIRKREKDFPIIIERLKKKEKIQVVFFTMSVGFWKYDSLFRLMQKHSRFEPIAVFTANQKEKPEFQKKNLENLRDFFKNKSFYFQENMNNLNPDILFYTQPYRNIFSDDFSIYHFTDKLLCYIPYSFFISNYSWAYDLPLHNEAWKLFYPTEIHRENAKQLAFNRGKNVCVTGYPLADFFLNRKHHPENQWKLKNNSLKRVIWAVHHAIFDRDLSDCSTFLDYYDVFPKMAQRYKDQVQFIFKPHPLLKKQLYQHPEWGPEKTDSYYDSWKNGENTNLIEGEYLDLFLTSDALIHDCGSFTVEYLYSQKPLLYIGNERSAILCPFGKRAMEVNHTLPEISIEAFIEKIILNGEDDKKKVRETFFEKYLLPPNGKTVAQNILDEIETSLS